MVVVLVLPFPGCRCAVCSLPCVLFMVSPVFGWFPSRFCLVQRAFRSCVGPWWLWTIQFSTCKCVSNAERWVWTLDGPANVGCREGHRRGWRARRTTRHGDRSLHPRGPVDASALAFFEEAEAKDLEVEYMDLVRAGFHNSTALLERMQEVVRRRQVLRQKGRGRKKRRRRKKRLPRSPRPRLVSGCCLRSTLVLRTASCLGPGDFLGRIPPRHPDVSVLYALLRPMVDARTCVSLWDNWKISVVFLRPLVSGSRLFDAVRA